MFTVTEVQAYNDKATIKLFLLSFIPSNSAVIISLPPLTLHHFFILFFWLQQAVIFSKKVLMNLTSGKNYRFLKINASLSVHKILCSLIRNTDKLRI